VRHVVPAASDGFHRGPSKTVPREVQRAHWNAPIDQPHPRELGGEVRRQAIGPRARKQRDVIWLVRFGKRFYHLMDVLANTSPGPQRWTVIDDYPHGAQTTISI